MGIGVRQNITTTYTCDKCGKSHSEELEGTEMARLPPDWSDVTIDGLPTPKVHEMARTLDPSTPDPTTRRMRLPFPPARQTTHIKRVFCDDCTMDVWQLIGVPDMPDVVGAATADFDPQIYNGPIAGMQANQGGVQGTPMNPSEVAARLQPPGMSINLRTGAPGSVKTAKEAQELNRILGEWSKADDTFKKMDTVFESLDARLKQKPRPSLREFIFGKDKTVAP